MEDLREYTTKDLEDWTKRIEDVAGSFGLDWYPQEFEIVDSDMMLSAMSYNGIPSYYPHWSFGKVYERQASLYKYGLVYLPYELVINANPSIAYLRDINPLPLHILTIPHVYGHNNFFKNNINFIRGTRADLALEFFRTSAERIRSYAADPSIGVKRVQQCIDAAHGLMYHSSRIAGAEYISQEEKIRQLKSKENSNEQPKNRLENEHKPDILDFSSFPLEPEENLLLFMRDYSPRRLEDWQKDIMTIVARSFEYFKPQILTKIMNEGWASYWHNKIIRALGLSADLQLAIDNYHSGVVRLPENPMTINPYYVGFKIWHDIFRKYEEPTKEEQKQYGLKGGEGNKQIFHVMRTAQDTSFLRSYLTQELMEKLNLLSYQVDTKDVFVDQLVNDESWKNIKQLLIRDVGMGSIPTIRIIHADYEDSRFLYQKHDFDGRNLDKEYTQKTLEYEYYFWGRPIYLETATYRKKVPFIYKYDGKSHNSYKKR